MNWHKLWTDTVTTDGARVLHAAVEILFIIVLLLVARHLAFRVTKKAMAVVAAREEVTGKNGATGRTRTLAGLLNSFTGYVLVFVAAFMILLACGVNPIPVLTAASVVGLAVGFGAQKLVKDVISGFFILLENQYTVGEYITIGTISGEVECVEMRTTRLTDDIGRLVIIPNGDISQVINHSRGALTSAIEVGVAPGTDIEKARRVLVDVAARFAEGRSDVLGPFVCDGVAAMDGTKVTLRVSGRIEPKSREEVQSALRARIREALVENGISIA